MTDELLTRVSNDEQDRVMLELERDQAWEAQQHHLRIAEVAVRELQQELRYRNRLRIKAEGFDKIARMICEVAASFRQYAEIEPVVDAVEAMEEIIKEQNHKLNVLLKAQEDGKE